MTNVFAAVASNHGVEATQVRALLTRRPFEVDASVVLTLGVLSVLIANVIIGGILNRFPMDAPTPMIVALIIVGLVLSAVGLLVLGVWTWLIELIRLGMGT